METLAVAIYAKVDTIMAWELATIAKQAAKLAPLQQTALLVCLAIIYYSQVDANLCLPIV